MVCSWILTLVFLQLEYGIPGRKKKENRKSKKKKLRRKKKRKEYYQEQKRKERGQEKGMKVNRKENGRWKKKIIKRTNKTTK